MPAPLGGKIPDVKAQCASLVKNQTGIDKDLTKTNKAIAKAESDAAAYKKRIGTLNDLLSNNNKSANELRCLHPMKL